MRARCRFLGLVLVFGLLLGLAPSARAQGQPPPLLVKRLPNGLVVQIQRDDRAPVVAVIASYLAGPRFERAGQRGAAARLRLAAFDGSQNLAAGEHRRLVASRGGRSGSELGEDALHLYEVLPAGEIELGLWLEADRMRGLEADLAPAVRGFADARMGPDRAVLTVVGDLAPDRVWTAIEARFAGIPKRGAKDETPLQPAAPPAAASAPPLAPGAGRMWIEWACPPATDPASDALEVAAAVLGAGPGARLSERLVNDEELAMSVAAEHVPLRGAGVFSIEIELARDTDPDAVRRSVGDVVAELAARPPSPDEWTRAARELDRRRREAHGDALGWALDLARTQMAGRATTAESAPPSPADLQRAVDLVLVRRTPSVRVSPPPPVPTPEGSP
jgi:zinc protease